jgi:hypothetical protein
MERLVSKYGSVKVKYSASVTSTPTLLAAKLMYPIGEKGEKVNMADSAAATEDMVVAEEEIEEAAATGDMVEAVEEEIEEVAVVAEAREEEGAEEIN